MTVYDDDTNRNAPERERELVRLWALLRDTVERIATITGDVDGVIDDRGTYRSLLAAQRSLLRTEAEQREHADTFRAILDAIPANVALLDTSGEIVTVNAAWQRFASENGLHIEPGAWKGQSYLGVCEAALGGEDATTGRRALDALVAALAGETPDPWEYTCHAPRKARWFRMVASPTQYQGRRAAVVMHVEVTERVLAEQRLREREQLLRAAQALAGLGAWEANLETAVLTWTPETCQLFGVDPESFGGSIDDFLAVVVQDDIPSLMEAIQRADAGGVLELAYRIRRPDGAVRHMCERGVVEFDDTGTAIRRHGMVMDVTEQHEREVALAESERRFRELAAHVEDVFYSREPADGRVLYVSPSYEHIWGRTCASLLADPRTLLDSVHPEDRPRRREALLRLERGESAAVDYRIVRPDGTLRWIHDRAYAVRSPDGRIERVVGIAHDDTEKRHSRAQLLEQAELLDHASDAIIACGPDRRVRYFNRSATAIYDWPREEALGRPLGEVVGADPAETAEAERCLLEDGEWSGRLRHRARDGSLRLIQARWTLVDDEAQGSSNLLAIHSDVTEQAQLETQMLRVQRLESIGTLAGGIAHDLNNILAPIMLSVEMLKQDVVTEEATEVLRQLEETARRGAALVRQVLTFARGGAMEKRVMSLSPLVREVTAICRDIFPRGIAIHSALPADVWPVEGDASRLHQVLMNLCVNARDAMGSEGALTVRLENNVLDEGFSEMNVEAQPGAYVTLTVSDTGCGIPPHILDRIFEPFFTTKGDEQGTGLGLSTSFTIVRDHGGFIAVDSELGRGSTFRLYLPAATSAEAAEELANERGATPAGQGELVLLVDDEASIRDVTRRTLERFGYRVLTAANGAEAVALYAQHRERIALVLTDMSMPVMDGPTLIVALAAIDPDLVVVGSSGLDDDDKIQRAVGAGVQHFLPKPYTATTLLSLLRRVLGDPPHRTSSPLPPAEQPTKGGVRRRRSSRPAMSLAPAENGRGGPTLLVVDDEAAIVRLLRRILTSAGYEVLGAMSGKEALAALETEGAAIRLVISDLQMDGMSGVTLARQAKERWPKVPFLFMSGDMWKGEERDALEQLGDVIEKPLFPDTLTQTIRAILER